MDIDWQSRPLSCLYLIPTPSLQVGIPVQFSAFIQGYTQLPVTPAPGVWVPSSGLHGYLHAHANKHRHIQILKIKSQNTNFFMFKLIRLSFCPLQLRIIILATITLTPQQTIPWHIHEREKKSFKVPGGNALGPQSKSTKWINIK